MYSTLEVLASAITKKSKEKAYKLKNNKVSLISNNMFIYMDYKKKNTKKLLKVKSKKSCTIQKLNAFL